ncbi:MAG: electron transfer flavoprotein subunit beta/FixA family protein [Planctomycetes bacterium]|nr:electron transfer flavoprotein subunit beta/FixA family protein [Planctomycetota bacterium]MCD7895366.1 electron transfer flavoprotein subunit beta/FixA family protein [Planctomycetaceae bacterium]
MNIVVCIKQVPDTTDVRIDPVTNTLVRQGVESIINPFDAYAIEEGVRIKERLGSGKVIIVTMGPPQAEKALREAISLGADEAVLLCSRAFAGGDTWATSLTLSQAMKKINPDVVLAGKQAIDGDTAQVGPGISCHLDWPQACYVSKIREIEKGRAVVECLMETGKEVLEVELPAVLTVVKEINEPRLPSLKGKMRAKKAEITVWSEADIEADPEKVGLKGSPTAVNRTFSPPRRTGGEIIQAETAGEAGKILVGKIKELQIG